MIIVIMGVAGSGKSTIGQMLADALSYGFLDGDSLHPQANVEKMTRGVPLTDEDRAPWLAAIHARIVECSQRRAPLVVACSALKQRYRETLAQGVTLNWVYLKGSENLIHERLQHRQHHFMTAQMLASQFADLEEPSDAITVEVVVPPDVAVQQIIHALGDRLAAESSSG
jgi:gluconokinase